MINDKDTLTINGIKMGQYITKATLGSHKYWGEDTGRNLDGEMVGTLIGIFPKITLQFRKLTQAELNIITPILDSATQTVVYYDPSKNANVTLSTYTGDWELVNNNIAVNEAFTCSFISKSKRL